MADSLPEDLAAALEVLADAIGARPDHADLARRFEWLIDALIMRGQIPASYRDLIKRVRSERSGVRLSVFRDKYAVESPAVDCAQLIPLCRARCCTFVVTLSAQDVAERVLPFDVTEPYLLPKHEDGHCACRAQDGTCTVYEHRPGACRAYDCRRDPRVWIDFDARIPAPYLDPTG